MPGLSKVIVLDPDARARRQVQLGFEREGVHTAAAATEAELAVTGEDPGLVVVGGVDGHGVELVRRARGWLAGRGIDVPLVFAGRGAEPRDATAAGADEVVRHPAYLRDVVTIGRLLVGRPADQRDRIVGNLIELTGVFTLVRALSALGRSATLTLIRGLRRGEVRFYFGEVTSAQVGVIHGQAALHQLLLWTDARFDFHHQDVVRRQQIPLSRDELFADAERFLEGVRDSSGGLSPAMVLEQDLPRVQALAKQIPTEVYGVLRMFDGHRALADVLEDSAYRLFETLRVAQRAVEAGLIRVVDKPPPRPGWRTVLAIEDWLVGGEPRDAVAVSDAVSDAASDAASVAVNDPRPATIRDARGAPVPPAKAGQGGKTARKRRKKKRRSDTPPAVAIGAAPIPEIDWGALVPRIVGAEVGPLAGVVPASQVSGEIVMTARSGCGADDAPTPEPTREPTIVFDEAADRAEAERVAAQRAAATRARAEAERAAVEARAQAERAAAEARAQAERAAADRAQAEPAAAEAHARAEAEQAAALALARAEAERAETERVAAEARARAEADRAQAEPAAAEPAAAEARAAAEAERAEAERAEADRAEAERAEAERVAIERAAAEAEQAAAMALARAEAERIAAERAAARARARAEAERVQTERAAGEAHARAAADRAAAAADRAEADRAAADRAEADRAEAERAEAERAEAERAAAAAEADRAEADRAAADRAAADRAEADRAAAERAAAEAKRAEAERTEPDDDDDDAAEARANAIRAVAATVSVSSEPAHVVDDLELSDTRPERPGAVRKPAVDPAAAAGSEAVARPGMPDAAVVEDSVGAVVSDAITAPMAAVSPPDDAAEPVAGAPDAAAAPARAQESTPSAVVDEPSDGVVRHHIATAETAPVKRRNLPHDPRDDDRPGETTGEITMPRARPQVVIRYSEPTILVPDLAHIQAEVVEVDPAAAPAAGGAHAHPAFSDTEEEFFQAGHDKIAAHHNAESFDDLDDGYRPVGFWERLTGRGKPDRTSKPSKKPR
jgi:hypothetical protein